MKAPHGTSVVDVADPKAPRQIAALEVPPRHHLLPQGARRQRAHAGQPRGAPGRPGARAGRRPADLRRDHAERAAPGRVLEERRRRGPSLHVRRPLRLHLAEMDGYVGNIMLILDLADPARPQEVGRWWMPGQWTAGGERPSWKGRAHRCHHPIRLGNRLLRQLLARRLRDPRHRGHGQAEARLRARLEPALHHADAHGAAGAVRAAGAAAC